MKKAYLYDAESKEYIGEEAACPSPLEKDVYLYPACSTPLPPPKTEPGETACFENQQWNVVKDFRGKKQIEIQTQKITTITHLGPLKKGFYIISEEQEQEINEGKTAYLSNGKLHTRISAETKRNKMISEAQFYLNSTDWYVLRAAEGIPVPQEVSQKRKQAREEISTLRKSCT